ncbi:MAG: zinc ribbon domain-containing protein [Clostridia bacterium]|nr:zinc ribbon domain-containing protein [Clostridia bacterium]
MNCIKCNAILPEGAKFCSLCGQPTKKEELTKNSTICINCRKEFDSSHVFCDRCGYRLMTKEHYIKECSVPILNVKSVKRFNGKKLKNKTDGSLVLYIDRMEFVPEVKMPKKASDENYICIIAKPTVYYFNNMKRLQKKKHLFKRYSLIGEDIQNGEVRFGKKIKRKKADAIIEMSNKYSKEI